MVRVVPFDLTRVSTVVVFGSREVVVLAERVVVLLDERFVVVLLVLLDERFVVLLGLVVVVERLVVVVVLVVLLDERFVVVVLVVEVPRVVVWEAERELCSRCVASRFTSVRSCPALRASATLRFPLAVRLTRRSNELSGCCVPKSLRLCGRVSCV